MIVCKFTNRMCESAFTLVWHAVRHEENEMQTNCSTAWMFPCISMVLFTLVRHALWHATLVWTQFKALCYTNFVDLSHMASVTKLGFEVCNHYWYVIVNYCMVKLVYYSNLQIYSIMYVHFIHYFFIFSLNGHILHQCFSKTGFTYLAKLCYIDRSGDDSQLLTTVKVVNVRIKDVKREPVSR